MQQVSPFGRTRALRCAALLAPLFLIGSCAETPLETAPVRLIDRFADAVVEQTPPTAAFDYEPTAWSFVDAVEPGFRVEAGVRDLRLEDGLLKGTTSSDQPLLVARRVSEVPASEVLHSVEVRARVSSGTELTARFGAGAQLVLPAVLGDPFGEFSTPLRTGSEMVTYVIRPARTVTPEKIDHVVLSPSNVAGAEFEIESVRLVFRGEHLAGIDSGIGWHGMSEIYRETLVTRSPEIVRYDDLVLPRNPAIEVAIATQGPATATFRVTVTPRGGGEAFFFEERVTAGDTWHPQWLDLDELEGRNVDVELALEADAPGTLGFWGAPAIRSRAPVVAESTVPHGVILLITDTLRSDHLEAYGYERSTAPNLSRLAAAGVRFENAVSQGTWTKVSVTAIQTSLYPSTHTVVDIPDRLPATAETLAEVYREAGYSTLALTTISFVGRLTNLHQGYEVLHEGSSIDDALGPKTAGELVDRLLAWLDQRRDVPFFVLLHVGDPHSPYRPKEENETTFAAAGDMDRLDELIDQVRPHITHHPLMQRFGMPRLEELVTAGIDPEEFLRHEKNGYDGSIRGMDDAIGRLVDGLEGLGLGERVLIGQVSDHGTEFLEHGAHFHGHTLYGELNRVPMILWGPGAVPAGRSVPQTVQTIDLMPTLLELSGLATPDGAQGETLTPLFGSAGEARWSRPAITEAPGNLRGSLMTAIQTDEWKLIRVGPPESEEPHYELYDSVSDPLNLTDMAGAHPEVVEQLAERMDSWRRFALAARLEETMATDELDADELMRLRSLGYVQ